MKVKIVNKSGFVLPKYETKNSAGMDIRAVVDHEETDEQISITLKAGERKLVKTGLFLEIPNGYEAQVRPRSGFALKQGVTVLNSPGTIDADYRGEVGVILINNSKEIVTITHGDRIAQLVFKQVEQAEFEEVDELQETSRGEGGFGSTGKN